MSEPMYAMQRANGEWLTAQIEGTLSLPVFRNAAAARRVHDRLGFLMVYRPQPLDSMVIERLKRQTPELKFWLVDEFAPTADLTPGRWLSPSEVITMGDEGDYAKSA
ncbi:MAG: hypothetical protein SNJ67_11310 [Chloracidobacterium sp.]|uniref:Uncharacterized protein n=1 Tax=Chloracidobacterium validum TaxID=2821543 RepID=A0ABX8B714_9BACT|nr:hypothetical protein [Chloracidobacterium validum]QUW02757.1 hypothetical protein J8C06_10535 [Chloracidobacterium validum]